MRLTLPQLRAIDEALAFRLAGVLDDAEIGATVYERAQGAVQEEIERRAGLGAKRAVAAFKPETLEQARRFLKQWEEMVADPKGRMNTSPEGWLALKFSMSATLARKLLAAVNA